jgi:sec-independent protein translocase protein TatA
MAVGPWQILVVVVLVLLLFGAGRLADIGKGLGEGIRNFKKGLGGDDDEAAAKEEPKQLPAKGESPTESKRDSEHKQA